MDNDREPDDLDTKFQYGLPDWLFKPAMIIAWTIVGSVAGSLAVVPFAAHFAPPGGTLYGAWVAAGFLCGSIAGCALGILGVFGRRK